MILLDRSPIPMIVVAMHWSNHSNKPFSHHLLLLSQMHHIRSSCVGPKEKADLTFVCVSCSPISIADFDCEGNRIYIAMLQPRRKVPAGSNVCCIYRITNVTAGSQLLCGKSHMFSYKLS